MARRPAAPAGAWTLTGRLGALQGGSVLFGPSRRIILSVNETAADIWRCLEEGLPVEAIVAAIRRRDVEEATARSYVEGAMAEWMRLGLLDRRADRPGQAPRACQDLGVGERRVRILYHAGTARLAGPFRHMVVPPGTPASLEVALSEEAERVHFFRGGSWLMSAAPDEAATALKGLILTDVLENGRQELALHVATLLRGERLALL